MIRAIDTYEGTAQNDFVLYDSVDPDALFNRDPKPTSASRSTSATSGYRCRATAA